MQHKSSYFPFQSSSGFFNSSWKVKVWKEFAVNFQQTELYQCGMRLHDIVKPTMSCLGEELTALCGPDKRSLSPPLSSNAASPAWGMSYVRGILASVFKHTEASLSYSNCGVFSSRFPSPPPPPPPRLHPNVTNCPALVMARAVHPGKSSQAAERCGSPYFCKTPSQGSARFDFGDQKWWQHRNKWGIGAPSPET